MRVDPATFLPHLTGLRFDQIEVMPQLIALTVAAVLRRRAARSATSHPRKYTRITPGPWPTSPGVVSA